MEPLHTRWASFLLTTTKRERTSFTFKKLHPLSKKICLGAWVMKQAILLRFVVLFWPVAAAIDSRTGRKWRTLCHIPDRWPSTWVDREKGLGSQSRCEFCNFPKLRERFPVTVKKTRLEETLYNKYLKSIIACTGVCPEYQKSMLISPIFNIN